MPRLGSMPPLECVVVVVQQPLVFTLELRRNVVGMDPLSVAVASLVVNDQQRTAAVVELEHDDQRKSLHPRTTCELRTLSSNARPGAQSSFVGRAPSGPARSRSVALISAVDRRANVVVAGHGSPEPNRNFSRDQWCRRINRALPVGHRHRAEMALPLRLVASAPRGVAWPAAILLTVKNCQRNE